MSRSSSRPLTAIATPALDDLGDRFDTMVATMQIPGANRWPANSSADSGFGCRRGVAAQRRAALRAAAANVQPVVVAGVIAPRDG